LHGASSSSRRPTCRAAAGASRRKIAGDVTNSPFTTLFLAHELGDEEPVVQPARAEVHALGGVRGASVRGRSQGAGFDCYGTRGVAARGRAWSLALAGLLLAQLPPDPRLLAAPLRILPIGGVVFPEKSWLSPWA
jgi:hypothetical protein